MNRLIVVRMAAAVLPVVLGAPRALCAAPPAIDGLDAMYASLEKLYMDLHQSPELSLHEEKTAPKMAAELRAAGFEVTEHVGGLGVVGVLKNGDGPVVLVRTDMDALPVKEQTGLPFASTVTAKNDAGETVPVMHACGHDAHMTCWVGAAKLLAQSKGTWHGTLLFVGQPAEEVGKGAKAMVKDGLLTRFPKPDFVIGIHVDHRLPAGHVGVIAGPASAASNSVDITFYGVGGHGAVPNRTIDPVIIASSAVMRLQTIVSREIDPLDSVVVTVGTFHAGNKRNIIPDEARLGLTVRTYKPEVQKKVLASIERIAKAEAAAAGAPREPEVTVVEGEGAEVVVNDPALAARLMTALNRDLGDENVVGLEPQMTSEDFGVYGRESGAPAIQLRLGAVDPKVFAEAKAAGRSMMLPAPHSPQFAPDRERTIKGGTAALVASATELMRK